MIRSILGSAAARLLTALLSLAVVLINARYFGAAGLGTIGLVLLAITLVLVVNNIVGGAALVYLAPRSGTRPLLVLSYGWALLVILAFLLLQQLYPLVPPEFAYHVALLSLLYSFAHINLNLLLGRERIKTYNILGVLQALVLLVVLYALLRREATPRVSVFITALYISYGFLLASSFFFTIPALRQKSSRSWSGLVREIFRLGAVNQLAYVAQTLNYRFNYYLLDHYTGRSSLGMFHFSNQLSEGTWIAARSMAQVQYMRISNRDDPDYARRLTLGLLKLGFVVTVLLVSFLLLIPDEVYGFFGEEYATTRFIMLCLAAGIISNAVSMMFSHYFSGLGRPGVNAAGSLIGLAFTLVSGFLLIPRWGMTGAGIAASLAYTAAMLYQMAVFFRVSGARYSDLYFRKEDWTLLRTEFLNWVKRPDR